MKKNYLFFFIVICYLSSPAELTSSGFEKPKKFSSEFHFGLRIPAGKTADDILSGFALKLGFGYQLTKNLELFHLAFDFGSSSPHDPAWVTVYDPNYYYGQLQQETVNIYGFPLMIRYRSQLREQLELYFGAGIAYYWFATRLSDPYWGIDLKKSRKRHGPGAIFEAGIFTDAFSDKILVGLITNFTVLETKGKTLTTPKLPAPPDEIITRNDYYLTFAICARYYMGK